MSGAFDFVGDLFGGIGSAIFGAQEEDKPKAPLPPAAPPSEDPAAEAARQEEQERQRLSRPGGRASTILAGNPLVSGNADEVLLG